MIDWKPLIEDPVHFVKALLKVDPYPHQADMMRAIANGYRKISTRSGRQIGKTTVLVWIAIWWIMTRPDRKVLVTAPSASQLADAFTPEFRKWVQRLPHDVAECWDVKAERFDFRFMPNQGFESFVTVRTARKDSPESLQGINARNGVLVLCDEASGIDDPLFESLSGSMASTDEQGRDTSVMVLTGNPNRNTGYFHDTHTVLAEQWYTLHVNSEDVPSVSRTWIEEMQLKYGQYSNAYRVHVLGEFPIAEDNTVMQRELVVAASVRDVALTTNAPKIWGVDPSGGGGDGASLVERQGNTVTKIKRWHGLNTAQLSSAILAEWDLLEFEDQPQEINVDSIGIGIEVVHRLQEAGLPVHGVNVSENPAMSDHYQNLKAEIWDKGRAWFEKRDCKIPEDANFIEQLCVVRKDFSDATAKMQIESKRKLRSRGVASPNDADAFVLTFAGAAGMMIHGFGFKRRKSIKRNLRWVV